MTDRPLTLFRNNQDSNQHKMVVRLEANTDKGLGHFEIRLYRFNVYVKLTKMLD